MHMFRLGFSPLLVICAVGVSLPLVGTAFGLGQDLQDVQGGYEVQKVVASGLRSVDVVRVDEPAGWVATHTGGKSLLDTDTVSYALRKKAFTAGCKVTERDANGARFVGVECKNTILAISSDTLALLRLVVKNEDIVVEAGSGVGMWTLKISELVGRGGRVQCYELHDYELVETTRLSGLDNVATAKAFVGLKSGMRRCTEYPPEIPAFMRAYSYEECSCKTMPNGCQITTIFPTCPSSAIVWWKGEMAVAALQEIHRCVVRCKKRAVPLLVSLAYDAQTEILDASAMRILELVERISLDLAVYVCSTRSISPPMSPPSLFVVSLTPRSPMPECSAQVASGIDTRGLHNHIRDVIACAGGVGEFRRGRQLLFNPPSSVSEKRRRVRLSDEKLFPQVWSREMAVSAIRSLQHPATPTVAGLCFEVFDPELSGHGSILGHLAAALNYGMHENSCVAVRDTNHYRLFPFLSTIMPRIGTCVCGNGSRVISSAVMVEETRELLPASISAVVKGGSIAGSGVALQWWYSQIQRYIVGTDFFADGDQSLHASKASRQSMVHSVLENIGLTYVGVHVRRGHKWVEQDPVPLDSYLAACAVMAAKLNTTDVLLVTEDPAVVRMVETRVNGTRAGHLKWHWTPHTRRRFSMSVPLAIRLGLTDVFHENDVATANLILLAKSSGLVCTLGSAFCKRALDLAGRQNGTIPVIAMDGETWSP